MGMSGALRIEMGVLFVTDRERIMVPTSTSTSPRFREYRWLLRKKKKESREVWQKRHSRPHVSSFHVLPIIGGSKRDRFIGSLVSKLTNGPFMSGGGV